MPVIDQSEDQSKIRTDPDATAVESIKLERNSRGYNWAIRVVRKEGEGDDDLLERLDHLNDALYNQYGR